VLRRRFLSRSEYRRDASEAAYGEGICQRKPINREARSAGPTATGRARPPSVVRRTRVRKRRTRVVVDRALASRPRASGRPSLKLAEADGRSGVSNARGDGECRGGEESGRRTHPDVRVRVIALRVRAVLDVRRVRLERRRRHLHAPPSAAAAAHGARLARTRVPVRSTLRGNQNRGTPDGASSVLARGRAPPAPAFAARARLARGRGLYHPSTLGGGTLCRRARRVETAPLRCRLSENIAKTKRDFALESTAFRVPIRLRGSARAASDDAQFPNQVIEK